MQQTRHRDIYNNTNTIIKLTFYKFDLKRVPHSSVKDYNLKYFIPSPLKFDSFCTVIYTEKQKGCKKINLILITKENKS